MKKIIVIGAGASGVFASILLKQELKDVDALIIEKRSDPLKKLLASGNGKCNIANLNNQKDAYYNAQFVEEITRDFKTDELLNFFDKLGIKLKNVDGLIYPYSETSKTVKNKLLEKAEELGVIFRYDEALIDYQLSANKITVKTDKNSEVCDYLLLASGGYTAKELGGSDSVINILKAHHYKIEELNPSLVPMKCKENTHLIEGLRCKCLASLYYNQELIHEEKGEVLFKKDGLSGIVIFNISKFINHLDSKKDIKIKLDLLPELNSDILSSELSSYLPVQKDALNWLSNYLHPALAKYVYNRGENIIKNVKELTFNFKDFYDPKFAQVMAGGVSINNLVKNSLESKLEPHLYFAGEILDVDAICGGYNLMWAFKSAHHFVKEIVHIVSNNK